MKVSKLLFQDASPSLRPFAELSVTQALHRLQDSETITEKLVDMCEKFLKKKFGTDRDFPEGVKSHILQKILMEEPDLRVEALELFGAPDVKIHGLHPQDMYLCLKNIADTALLKGKTALSIYTDKVARCLARDICAAYQGK